MIITPKLLPTLLVVLLVGCSEKQPAPKPNERSTESAEHTAAGVKINAQTARNVGIEVAVAGPATIRETLSVYGSIKSNAEREQDIRPRYAGVIHSVNKRAGDHVDKNDVLLTVESNESLQTYSVVSPLAGQVLERSANPGDAVDTSTVLMKVVDLSTVWIEFAIFAHDLTQVRPGKTVLFHGTEADDSSTAKISYVSPAGRADSQSVVARAVIDNRSGTWVPGQFITGDIVIADSKVAVAVVPTALQELNGKTTVFVQSADGFEPREVHVGKRSRDAVEITHGLNVGESYVAKNSYLIKADLLKGAAEEE